MARIIAFEWNTEQLRVAVGSAKRNLLVIERLLSFALPTSPEERDRPELSVSEDLAREIGELLAGQRFGRAEAIALVSRTHVELRQLTLPPAPDEELPEMVRFQAAREFTSIGEDWPLDFLPLDGDPNQPRNILAAAIDPRLVAGMQKACDRAGLKLKRIGIRPFAAASLILRQQGSDRPEAHLLLGLFGDEADLSLIVEDRVVLSRCARLHADPLLAPEGVEDLIGQVRRTIAAAQGQLGSRRVHAITLFGGGPGLGRLRDQVASELSQPVHLVDPAGGVSLKPQAAGVSPEHRGEFAPLIGALLDEVERRPPALDFLQPRRRPEAPTRRPTYTLAGAAAMTLLAAIVVYGWVHGIQIRDEINTLQTRVKNLEAEEQKLRQLESIVEGIAAWEQENVNWLEELHHLATKLPGAEDVMLRQLKLTLNPTGGQVDFEGLARSLESIEQLERQLQDENRVVAGKSKNELASPQHYRYEFRSGVRVQTPQASQSRQPPAAARPVTRPSAPRVTR